VEHIDWRARDLARLEQESSLRGKIFNDIVEYADNARNLGMSDNFVSGVEVAAEIALFGRREPVRQDQLPLELPLTK
jgi:hypothetical protein